MKVLRALSAAVAIFLTGAYLSHAIEPAPQAPEDGPRNQYRVTGWPEDTPAQPYHQHVEAHLNKMAAEGWSFKTVIVGQREKMMVFERRREQVPSSTPGT